MPNPRRTPGAPGGPKSAAALPRRVAIVAANRLPFARSNGAYTSASNQQMLTAALDGLLARTGLEGEQVGEFVAGAVLKHSSDFNLARETVLGSRLSPDTPAFDVQQACATGIEAIVLVANKIALGQLDSGIAGGVDTTSDAPLSLSPRLRRILLDANRQKTTQGKLAALARIRPAHLAPEQPRNAEPRTGLAMGDHAALTAVEFGVTRQDQDELAVRSHHRLAAAYDRGFYDDLVTPYLGLERDDNLRPDSSTEKLATLRTVFGRGDTATMTAANSTPLTDGASVVLLASEDWAAAHGLPVLAYLGASQAAAVDHVHGGEGLLMAPVKAVPQLLARAGLTFADIDLFEIHEAFASQVLATLAAWADPVYCVKRLGLDGPLGEVDPDRLNVNGGSLAAGHPFAATGGRVVANAAKALAERGGGRALVSVCAAGGQGVVAIVEL